MLHTWPDVSRIAPHICCYCRRLRCTCCQRWCQLTLHLQRWQTLTMLPTSGSTNNITRMLHCSSSLSSAAAATRVLVLLLLLQAVALHLLSALVSADVLCFSLCCFTLSLGPYLA